MKLYRKNYKAIAKIIKKNRLKNDTASWRMIKQLADYFEKSNPLFDRGCFLKACGL